MMMMMMMLGIKIHKVQRTGRTVVLCVTWIR